MSLEQHSLANKKGLSLANSRLPFGGSLTVSPASTSSKTLSYNHRKMKDRRSRPTPMISRYLFVGSRQANHRLSDPQNRYYVDRPRKALILQGTLIILLGAIDAILTFFVLKNGGVEVNPLVRLWLSQGWGYCLLCKFFFMSMGIFILVLHQNFLRMKYIIGSILTFYGTLIAYQAFLLFAA